MTDTSHIDRLLEPEREPDLEAEPADADDPIAQNVDRLLERDADSDSADAEEPGEAETGAEAHGGHLALAPPPGAVPIHALHRERAKHRETQKALANTLASKADMEQAFERLLASPSPEAGPGPARDEDTQGQSGDAQFERRLSALEGIAEGPSAGANYDRDAAARHVLEQATLREVYADAVDQFRHDVPDYMDAARYLDANVSAMLEADGHSDPDARREIMRIIEGAVAEEALRSGANPAQRFYEMAKRRGYKSKRDDSDAPAETQPIAALMRGQEASASLGGAAGTHVNETSLAHLAELDGAEFDAAWERMRKAGRLG